MSLIDQHVPCRGSVMWEKCDPGQNRRQDLDAITYLPGTVVRTLDRGFFHDLAFVEVFMLALEMWFLLLKEQT